MDKAFAHSTGSEPGLWSTYDQSTIFGRTIRRGEKKAELRDSRSISPRGSAEAARRERALVTRFAPGHATPATKRWALLRRCDGLMKIVANERTRELAAGGGKSV